MTLLYQSLGFGVLFGLFMLFVNYDKPNKLLIFLKYFLIGTGGHYVYEWILG